MNPRDYPNPARDLICQVEREHEREHAERLEADERADRLDEQRGVYCLATPIPALLRRAS